ncbi:MAG: hypothetical protein AW09_004362 [Candidatus Accumulibacter phosphatis]|uniref:Uncharacterized protein n=1 Tax=Candidatus Accumulibacter phosphatis TaxID=327160 RepID=A0A080LR03_9PROT|nr:MAG: hypothetical protein AW09_004362 [Candidatus Accumulibacter phosphatis]
MPDQFFATIVQHALEFHVDVDEAAASDFRNAHRRRTQVEGLGKAFFAFPQCSLGASTLGDVQSDTEDFLHLALSIADRLVELQAELVDEGDHPLRIQAHDDDVGVLDEFAVFVLALQQCLIHLLARGNVLDRTDHLDRRTVLIEFELPEPMHPALLAVAVAEDTVLPVEAIAFGENVVAKMLEHLLSVFRVYQVDPACDGLREGTVNAEDLVELLRTDPGTCAYVEIIGTQATDFLRSSENKLALAKCLVGLVTLDPHAQHRDAKSQIAGQFTQQNDFIAIEGIRCHRVDAQGSERPGLGQQR